MARPVMIATAARCESALSPCCTSCGTRASHGRSTIGASVPSISNASSVLPITNAPMRAKPSGDSACFTASLYLDTRRALVGVDSLGNALTLPQPRGVEQHGACPAIDIELLHQPPHAAHAYALLVGGHGQCPIERVRALLAVIRVDEQRVVQLPRRARELRQHQHTLLV